MLELKRSTVAVSEGIRQNIGNQKQEFIRPFFTTVQLADGRQRRRGPALRRHRHAGEVLAGRWKEAGATSQRTRSTAHLLQLCSKARLLELIHDFMVFDAGVKKTLPPQPVLRRQGRAGAHRQREGGIIWHTQGSGKSLTMVWLAKWIREHQPDARVLIITDRTELDEQIEKVFDGVNEDDLPHQAAAPTCSTRSTDRAEWLICSLVHKFRGSDDERRRRRRRGDFIEELNASCPKDFSAKGNLFVFVDEATAPSPARCTTP